MLTPRRVTQLVHEGVVPRAGRGKYPLKDSVQAYCRYKDQLLLKKGSGGEMAEEKLRTARLERRRKELEFEKLEGNLITTEHHESVLADAFRLVRSSIRNIPGALAPRIAGLDDPRDVERVLVPALDDALRAIVEAGKSFADDRLPDGFPGRKALERAGVTTFTQLSELDDLRAVKGVGPKTAAAVEEWLA